MDELNIINEKIKKLEEYDSTKDTIQQRIATFSVLDALKERKALLEHTLKIKNKVESGNAIDKNIVDREATKELNNKQAHKDAVKVKKIEHKLREVTELSVVDRIHYPVIVYDMTTLTCNITDTEIFHKFNLHNMHIYVICYEYQLDDLIALVANLDSIEPTIAYKYIHTFKYSSKKYNPRIGFKEHYECILYINIGNKPVNHLLPNVIESTYEKDSRNAGLYTNLLLRSAQAGDTILGINITNGNLIKAAQAMLCSTVIVPVDNVAMRECEKTIKELQFK